MSLSRGGDTAGAITGQVLIYYCAVLAAGKRVTGDRRRLQRTIRLFKLTQIVDRAHLRRGTLPRWASKIWCLQRTRSKMQGVLTGILNCSHRGHIRHSQGPLVPLGPFNHRHWLRGFQESAWSRCVVDPAGWHLAPVAPCPSPSRPTPVLATCSHPVKRICSAWLG